MRTQETVASMLCPVCKTGLSMSDRSGVEIDFCPSAAACGWTGASSTKSSNARSRQPLGKRKVAARGGEKVRVG